MITVKTTLVTSLDRLRTAMCYGFCPVTSICFFKVFSRVSVGEILGLTA